MHMFSDQIPVGRDVYVAITFDEVKPPLSLSGRPPLKTKIASCFILCIYCLNFEVLGLHPS